jgi:hypothetical protein
LEHFNIKDIIDLIDPSALMFVRVEVLPETKKHIFEEDFDLWTFKVDERFIPDWFSPAHRKAVLSTLAEFMKIARVEFPGNFYCGEWFNQPLPAGFSCKGSFYCGKKFNQVLPEGFSCKDSFHCGHNYNQIFPKGFVCESSFHCGESFNQTLPEGFICGGNFYCGEKFNQPLPDGFICKEDFNCGESFNMPLSR